MVNPDGKEELALTLNGKKGKIERKDFVAAFENQKLDRKQQLNIFQKVEKSKLEWMRFIEFSFLSNDLKTSFMGLIRERLDRLK